jgi:hypothetical protein
MKIQLIRMQELNDYEIELELEDNQEDLTEEEQISLFVELSDDEKADYYIGGMFEVCNGQWKSLPTDTNTKPTKVVETH